MANVGYIREEIAFMRSKWDIVKDCISGQEAVKRATDKYLPRPNSADTSPENNSRYEQYVERAVFYNVTQRTHGGLVGQVFRRSPIIELPQNLEILIDDVDGAGVTLEQQAKKVLGETLAFGRCGLLVDYPTLGDEVATVEDVANGYIRPTITLFEPWEIINWRIRDVGAKKLLSLIVLKEDYVLQDDGFEVTKGKQYRVLRLDNAGHYNVEVYREQDNNITSSGIVYPKDANGEYFTEIPFVFVGAVNNDVTVDLPPLYDMAVLNIAHYRNSADYEESCFIVGQPTPYFSGLTQSWVEDVFKNKTIALGSRVAIPLPEGGKAGLLQATENSMPKEAMELKEKQMISLGAKLVEQSTVQRTATEARQEEASESSILSTCAKNVGSAYTVALKLCSRFVSNSEETLKFELNTEFDLSRMDATEIQQTVANWLSGAVTFVEMRKRLRKAGITSVTDEEALASIKQEAELRASMQPKPAATKDENQPTTKK